MRFFVWQNKPTRTANNLHLKPDDALPLCPPMPFLTPKPLSATIFRRSHFSSHPGGTAAPFWRTSAQNPAPLGGWKKDTDTPITLTPLHTVPADAPPWAPPARGNPLCLGSFAAGPLCLHQPGEGKSIRVSALCRRPLLVKCPSPEAERRMLLPLVSLRSHHTRTPSAKEKGKGKEVGGQMNSPPANGRGGAAAP